MTTHNKHLTELDKMAKKHTDTTTFMNNVDKYVEQPWTLIESYFEGQHLSRMVRHQIESYNDFVTYQIKKTINMFNPVHIKSERDLDEESGKYGLEMIITFDNLHIFRPQAYENNGATKVMFPQEARLRNFTYASAMTVDINIKIIRRTGDMLNEVQMQHMKLPNIHIGKLPIMLKSCICVLNLFEHIPTAMSGECKFDAGGYFIINGSEKTVLAQERAAENRIYCFDKKKGNSKWSWRAEIKSVPDFKIISPKQISMMIASKNNGFGHPIYMEMPQFKNPIPLFLIFRALGIVSDQEIVANILLHANNVHYKRLLFALRGSIVDANTVVSQEEAFDYVTMQCKFRPINMTEEEGNRRKREFTRNALDVELFPHCKTSDQKKYFLGYMAYQLIAASVGLREADDRDSYLNKRIDLAGTLLNNLFRNYFNKLVKDMQKQIIREINTGSWRSTDNYMGIITKTNIYKIVKSTTIENGLKRALATGDFGVKNGNSNKVGVAQVLNRLTYASTLSHLRRISTPIDKSGKLIPPRKLHNTSWGFICPSETPEGQSVGVVKNISYMAHVTIPSTSYNVYDVVEGHITPIETLSTDELKNKVKVFINGNWVGVSEEPYTLFMFLKEKKYSGVLNVYTSVIFNYKDMEIRVCTDSGRLTRPVLRVIDNNVLLTEEIVSRVEKNEMSWDDLMLNHKTKNSMIEYIDAEEQNFSMIAMKPKHVNAMSGDAVSDDPSAPKELYHYTHCEIHPSTIFGVLSSCIPFPEHNQAPRVTYQAAMGKQAMGMYATNFDHRMDTTSYVLTYAMRPMVDTRVMNMLQLNNIPSGEMVIVAIGTYSGYNQEDSIIFNQGALDRGLFAATVYNTERDEDKKIGGDEEIRCKPDKTKTKGMKFANYGKLNAEGFMPENSLIENRDVIIGKVVPIKENKNDYSKVVKYTDQSTMYRTHEECYIDKNYVDRNGDGYTFCKVRIRRHRKPVIGDKFSSRHGQKGTIGVILPEENMPFTASGVRPDIIINPHAIPSRMTIGQLKETLLGKVLLDLGLFGDGTSFNELSVKKIADELLNRGFEAHGNEVMMNGMTGEQMETSLFMGPAFYQRLKHMVNDKQHSRSFGPMVVLTRQPAEGRSRDGGLRFGEMERDATIANGMSRFTKGRMYDASDKFKVHTCNKCGMIASFNNEKEIHVCNMCDNRSDFSYVELPYACKLLFQELISMNVAPRILTE